MNADQIREHFHGLVYTAPCADRLSQNDVAAIAAHFWPAIEQHVRQAVSKEFTKRGRSQDSFSWGEAALIARGEL